MTFLSNITPRFHADFSGLDLIQKSSMETIERYFLHCRSFTMRRKSILSGFSFSLFVHMHEWTNKNISEQDHQSINQSNFYTANIPGEVRLSGATAKSVFNSKIEETVP